MAYGGYEDNGYYAKQEAAGNKRAITSLRKDVAKRDVIIQKLVKMVDYGLKRDGGDPLTKEELKAIGILQKMLKTKIK